MAVPTVETIVLIERDEDDVWMRGLENRMPEIIFGRLKHLRVLVIKREQRETYASRSAIFVAGSTAQGRSITRW